MFRGLEQPLRDEPMVPKTVYLDQMAWINLSKVHFGKSEEWREAYDAVWTSRRNGMAVFPLSLAHLNETVRCRSDGSRTRLLDFMWKLSGGFAVCPWPNLIQPEAYNVVRQLQGQKTEDLRGKVFGFGIPKILGAHPTLVQKTPGADPPPAELQHQITEFVYGPEAWKLFQNPRMAGEIREAINIGEDFAEDLQKRIDEEYAHPDKVHRQKLVDARSLTGEMGDAFVRATLNLTENPKLFMAKHLTSKEDALRIRKMMPTYHTFHVLNDARNRSRAVKANDIWDLALSLAIPYCDIVYTEREWCSVATQAGLDELRETRLVCDPESLPVAL